MFIAVQVTIANMQKQRRCPSIDKWKKKCDIFTLAVTLGGTQSLKKRKNEISSFAAKWS